MSLATLQKAGQLLLSPFAAIGTSYARAAAKRPFTVGVITTGLKTSAADMFAQMVMERREWSEVDWTRQAAFTFFGFTYLGAFQYFFYTRVLGTITAPITAKMGHIASAPIKTFIDQAVHHPFIYFPSFYYLKYTLVKGDDASVAMGKYREDLWVNCQALWSIWVPAQLLNFAIVPMHLQIPFAAAISFVWTVVLSMMRGAFDDKTEMLAHIEGIETDKQGAPITPEIVASDITVDGKSTVAVVPTEVAVPSATEASQAEAAAPAAQTNAPVPSVAEPLHPFAFARPAALSRCTAGPKLRLRCCVGGWNGTAGLLAMQHPLQAFNAA